MRIEILALRYQNPNQRGDGVLSVAWSDDIEEHVIMSYDDAKALAGRNWLPQRVVYGDLSNPLIAVWSNIR